ncbi:helix-turn-helix transcriptional regulator [Streptomyces cyslabdanicus]|uniref:helix-turn-helix transcriptional regulator n=1 Tax=Streptomyces cyslabdanicus TaxID=1470456 RepID=UPI00404432FF
MTSAPHPDHQPEDLCSPGTALYERALRQGQVAAQEAAVAPCLVDFGLLYPSVADASRLEPVPPAAALHRLLRGSAERIAEERRREERLTETFETLMRVEGPRTVGPRSSALRLLSGTRRINQAITETMAEASQEILCVQPHSGLLGRRVEEARAVALVRDQELLDRGGRIRTLYQHTLRHVPSVAGYHEKLTGDVEVRTLDEVTDRLIIVDLRVAFIPANGDGTLALEVRHPALVGYFATTFDRLWRLATPMYPLAVPQPSAGRVTPRQRAIAGLLVEGHTDAVIAERLGMNVRTAREHIAKLAATLGSGSRAQLGYLIGQSGILDPEP